MFCRGTFISRRDWRGTSGIIPNKRSRLVHCTERFAFRLKFTVRSCQTRARTNISHYLLGRRRIRARCPHSSSRPRGKRAYAGGGIPRPNGTAKLIGSLSRNSTNQIFRYDKARKHAHVMILRKFCRDFCHLSGILGFKMHLE